MEKIGVYIQNIEGVWCGVACDEKQVFATTFSRDKKVAAKNLTDCLPSDVNFQVLPTPSPFAERALKSVKNVYDAVITVSKSSVRSHTSNSCGLRRLVWCPF
jgi:hypothetical protein